MTHTNESPEFPGRFSIRFQVTGSVFGDVITMAATGGGETVNATATITRDADMEPTSATGTWPEGNINLVSCRLN